MSASGQTKPKNAGESEFLSRQATDARAAISAVIGDIKRDLGASVDPRKWTEAHPWASLAVAAAGGFAAAAVLVPSHEQQALNRLKRIERALRPESDPKTNGEASGSGSMLSTIAGHAFNILKPVLMSVLAGAVSATTAQQTTQDSGGASGAEYSGQMGQSGA